MQYQRRHSQSEYRRDVVEDQSGRYATTEEPTVGQEMLVSGYALY